MNLINNKKIPDTVTITLTYNNKDLTFTLKRFNKLSKVKEKAFQLFYPIKSDIKLKYNNKDLSEFLEQSIGLIFENKTRLKIKIEPQIGTQRLVKKLILKSNKNILYRNSEIDKQALSTENYKSLNTETANKIKYIKKLPPIKNNIASNFFDNLGINMFTFKICRDCTRKKTNNFCRKCNAFICSNCAKKKHKNHSIFEINLNDEKSNIEKYNNELMNKFSSTINDLNNLKTIEKEELSEDEWRQKYNKAINRMTQIIQKNIQKFNNNDNDNNEEKNKKDENKDFKKKLKEEKNNINNIEISINKDPFKLFKEINEKEKYVQRLIKTNNKEYNKLDEMFDQIENQIDDIIYNLEEEIFSKID